MIEPALFTARDAAAYIRVPTQHDDKYSRGVLGVLAGSTRYPGAAVLTVEAALRTGVGMVRYRGAPAPAALVLQRRPEAVTADGRVQAWVLGPGMETSPEMSGAADPSLDDAGVAERVYEALGSGHPLVIDAGALDGVVSAVGPAVITPHARELARLLGVAHESVVRDPLAAARTAASRWAITVVIKGHSTLTVAPSGEAFRAQSAPTWLATAGAGDALAGILGALVATHADAVLDDAPHPGSRRVTDVSDQHGGAGSLLARLAATAAVVHGLAAQRASAGGPLAVLDLCRAVSPTIAELLAASGAPAE